MSSQERHPIKHRKEDCGGQVGWWLGPIVPHEIIRAEQFEFMDGTSPRPGTPLRNLYCPKCEDPIMSFKELVRNE